MVLTAVSPGARIGEIDLPNCTGGVIAHEGGLTAVLEIEPELDTPAPLPPLLALLPMAEVGEPPITAQIVVETVPVSDSAIPARRHGWVALQAVRTNDRSGSDVDELRAALTGAIRRTQRRLGKSGFSSRVLGAQELAGTIEELGYDGEAIVEEWAHWRTPACVAVTLSVVASGDLSVIDRLPEVAGVPTVLALGIRRVGRGANANATAGAANTSIESGDQSGVEVEASVRLVAATQRDADRAASAVNAAGAAWGLRLRRMDGEHVHGVASTLPLGAFLR
ncbi:type VII secretion protein EccE [Cryptosporangium japonicum]|uniref:Type VII secretion system protein EccE domain-containing protein n=1 Tax=Cryptosporangium japonicum TaxID=80872 RepID=A0ABN0UWQ0_9ACTN